MVHLKRKVRCCWELRAATERERNILLAAKLPQPLVAAVMEAEPMDTELVAELEQSLKRPRLQSA